MQNAFLLLTLITATIGFILWYSVSSSLRLPVQYQVHYDANPPYVNRVLRRRALAAILFAGIPLFIIHFTGLIGHPSWNELNVDFTWNGQVALYSGIGIAVAFLFSLLTTKSHANLEVFPEVRVRFWRPGIIIWSALSWVLYVFAIEFFYRGLLLQSLLFKLDIVSAIAICAALYSLTHYFRRNRMTIAGILWGVLSCHIVLLTESLLAVIIIHLAFCLFVEWFSIRNHVEMYVRRT
jgi:membrane protease YdiL (CAAX protease family)